MSVNQNYQPDTKHYETPSPITQSELTSLVCFFNWNLCSNISQAALKERIDALERHIDQGNKDLFPQSYSLLGYLKSLLQPRTTEIERKVSEHFLKAIECLPECDENSTKKGLGSRALMVANSLVWKHKLRQMGGVSRHFKEYAEICDKYKKIEKHPEVLAIKGFAFGHISSFQERYTSVQAYTEALSDETYQDQVEWLFGLAHSMTFLSHRKYSPSPEKLREIEKIWRRVIQIKPEYSLAMLKLARILFRLHGVFALEEIEHWIETALKQDKTKGNILEEAAFLYKTISRDKADYTEKALNLFNEAIKHNAKSKKAIEGLASVSWTRFRNNKRIFSRNDHPPYDLMLAMENFEKSTENKRHYDRLILADVYFEISTFRGYRDFATKAEDTIKAVKEEVEKEKDPLRIAQVYTKYAEFLKKQERWEEEVSYLREVAAMSIHDENIDENEMRFVDKSQATLLRYASGPRFSEPNSLELKGFVLQKKKNFQAAIFCLKKAINNPDPGWTESYKTTLKENLVETLIEASKENLSNYPRAIPKQWAVEAEKEIANLGDTPRKYDFKFKVATIYTNELMVHEKLQTLKKYRLNFEQVYLDIMKESLKNINSCLPEAEILKKQEREKQEEIGLCLDIVSESKRVLDRAINVIKDNVFPSVKKTVSCYYPSPKAIDSQSGSDLSTKLKTFLESRLQLENFKTKLPDLFKFLLKKQPDLNKKQSDLDKNEYVWLQGFFHIRNELSHKVGAEKLLKEMYPNPEDRKYFVDQMSLYAAEVWNRFQSEINNRDSNLD